ncbi:MAG: hypothetical protein FWE58_06420 [Methanobrevibacter sp.]|nr:hypothetical protein [Methanobrevibacter sp.]
MTYGMFNNKKIAFQSSDDFDIVDINNEGYIVRLANNITGAVISVAVAKNSGESLEEIKNTTEDNLKRNGLNILSSNVKSKLGKETVAINYIQSHQGVNVSRESIAFLVKNDLYTFEYVTIEGQSTSKDEEAFRIAIESLNVKESYY